tara:strand:+ start:142 stop:858 length:717 start_codon:yes stop_codon:yes gene_type:complete
MNGGESDTQRFDVLSAEIINGEIYVELKRDLWGFASMRQILNIKLTGDLEELKTNGKVGEIISFESSLGKEKEGWDSYSPMNEGLINMKILYFSGFNLEEMHEGFIEGKDIIKPPTQLKIVAQRREWLSLFASPMGTIGDAGLGQVELAGMKVRALQKLAEELGVDSHELDDAEEKSEVIALITAARSKIAADSHIGTHRGGDPSGILDRGRKKRNYSHKKKKKKKSKKKKKRKSKKK